MGKPSQKDQVTVLILHGLSGHAGIHWMQWLHDQLVEKGYQVIMPTFPDSHHPDRHKNLEIVCQLLSKVDPAQLVIVAHSLGVSTALDYIEQSKGQVLGLVSVAGFAFDHGSPFTGYFMRSKTLDFSKVNAGLKNKFVIFAPDDPYVGQKALRQLADALQTEPIIIPKGGHFISSSGYSRFPRLLDLIIHIR